MAEEYFDATPLHQENIAEKENVPQSDVKQTPSFFSKKMVLRAFLGLLTGAAVWGVASKLAHIALYPALPLPKDYSDDDVYEALLNPYDLMWVKFFSRYWCMSLGLYEYEWIIRRHYKLLESYEMQIVRRGVRIERENFSSFDLTRNAPSDAASIDVMILKGV